MAEETEKPGFWSKYQKSIWIGLVSMAVLTAGLLAYLLFFRNTTPAPEFTGDVRLTVTAPAELSSGSEISYGIKIENLSNTSLLRQELEIFYPSGFTFVDSTPDLPDGQERKFTFSDLRAGEEESVTIAGRLEGELQEIKTMSAKLHYVPENFKSVFAAEGQAETIILSPDLTLAIAAPTEGFVGQAVTYEIRVANVSSRTFSDVVVRAQYPDKFVLKSATPAPHTGQTAEWRLPVLAVGQTTVIAVSGTLTGLPAVAGEPGRDSAISAELFLKNSEGILVRSHKSMAFTTLKPPPLSLVAALPSGAASLKVGEEQTLEISYRNNSQIGLTNVQISAVFESPGIASLKISKDKALLKNNIVSWIPATHPALAVVKAGASGAFTIRFQVTDEVIKSLQKNPVVIIRPEFQSAEIAEPLAGTRLELKVSSQLGVKASVTKTAPPAGEAGSNVYKVELAVSNTVNDVADAELVAEIGNPASVVSLNENDASYSGVTGILRWRVGEIFPFAAIYHEPRQLTFEITSDGAALFKNIKLSGKDQFTGENLTAELSAITVNQ